MSCQTWRLYRLPVPRGLATPRAPPASLLTSFKRERCFQTWASQDANAVAFSASSCIIDESSGSALKLEFGSAQDDRLNVVG